MSVERHIVLMCDGAEDCDQTYEPGSIFAREVRLWAKQDGWTTNGIQDFCPTHSKARSAKQ